MRDVHVPTPSGRATVRFSERADGDLNADVVASDVVAARWRALAGRPVTWLREVHGTDVVVVSDDDVSGRTGDAVVTATAGRAVGVWVGDCAPIALVADEGIVSAAHAGWRGLLAGVVREAVAVMRGEGASRISAVVGPCLHAECYEFSPDDLVALADAFGPGVVGTTSWGTPGFDLPAAVAVALAAEGVTVMPCRSACTACDERYWSHRARRERGRHGMAVWFERTEQDRDAA